MHIYLFQGIAGEVMLVDPVQEEEKLCREHVKGGSQNHGLITISMMGAHTQVSQVWQTGSMTISSVTKALSHLVQCCEETYPIAQRCLVKSVVNTISKKTPSIEL